MEPSPLRISRETNGGIKMTFDELTLLLQDNNIRYKLGDLVESNVEPNKDLWEFFIVVDDDDEEVTG